MKKLKLKGKKKIIPLNQPEYEAESECINCLELFHIDDLEDDVCAECVVLSEEENERN